MPSPISNLSLSKQNVSNKLIILFKKKKQHDISIFFFFFFFFGDIENISWRKGNNDN